MFRFLIAKVRVDPIARTMEVLETDIVEAVNFNGAAADAESKWPGFQLSVTKIGRIHNASASDHLPLASGAGA